MKYLIIISISAFFLTTGHAQEDADSLKLKANYNTTRSNKKNIKDDRRGDEGDKKGKKAKKEKKHNKVKKTQEGNAYGKNLGYFIERKKMK